MLRRGASLSAAEKPEQDLTATLHLGVRAVIENSSSARLSEILERLADEDRQIIEKLAPENAMLIVHRGPGKGSRFLLTTQGSTIGRSPENDIFLDDVTISRKHAQIIAAGAGLFTLKDLGSLNGTYVNNKSVTEISLTTGDEIQFGKFHMLFLRGNK